VAADVGLDDGFIAGLEVSIFAAVLLGVLLTIVELFGLQLAQEKLARATEFSVAYVADGYAQTAPEPGLFGDYDATVSMSDNPCPMVAVQLRGVHVGVVSGRVYALTHQASQIITLYRNFSPVSDRDTC